MQKRHKNDHSQSKNTFYTAATSPENDNCGIQTYGLRTLL